MKPQPSRPVAEALASIWSWHRTPQFLDYVADSFGVRVSAPAVFDALYIYQVTKGDLERGSFDHSAVLQWWEVTDAGMSECAKPAHWSGWVDAPEKLRGSFYRWPHISFLHVAEQVGFGEWFGPGMLNRKAGRLVEAAGGIEIRDVRVIWRSNEL